jgi:hypothetical protein
MVISVVTRTLTTYETKCDGEGYGRMVRLRMALEGWRITNCWKLRTSSCSTRSALAKMGLVKLVEPCPGSGLQE